jgi:hypothetical protein
VGGGGAGGPDFPDKIARGSPILSFIAFFNMYHILKSLDKVLTEPKISRLLGLLVKNSDFGFKTQFKTFTILTIHS